MLRARRVASASPKVPASPAILCASPRPASTVSESSSAAMAWSMASTRARRRGWARSQMRCRAASSEESATREDPLGLHALGLSLEPLRRAAEEEVAHLGLGRPAQQQPEHPARVDHEGIRRARDAVPLLELPPALERLGLALLLHPGDPVGRVVVEAKAGPDLLDLGVGLGLHQARTAVVVALEHLDVDERPLPFGRAFDVGGNVEAPLARRLDVDRSSAADDPQAQGIAYPARWPASS